MADRHDHLQEAGASSSSSASSKPEQQHSSSNTTRDRNASSSVDSGFSLSTLEESLPSLSQSNGDDPQDNATGYEHEQRDADGQASQLKEDENNTADAAEERQIDEHHKAL